MNLDTIRLQPNDPYLDKWIQTLIPLLNKNKCYEQFMKINWFDSVILGRNESSKGGEWDPGIQVNQLREASNLSDDTNNDSIIHLDSSSPVSLTPSMKTGVWNDGNILENLIKYFWLPYTLRNYKKLGKPWWVVISDTMLKFHDKDQRRIYQDL